MCLSPVSVSGFLVSFIQENKIESKIKCFHNKMSGIQPIIKWAGGKTKIIPFLTEIYNYPDCNRYIDLFCGSLSIPLHFLPKKAVLNDINTGIIVLYKMVKNQPKKLISELEKLNQDSFNNKESFQQIKDEFNILKNNSKTLEDDLKLASYFIYLNKRSFNGLYRENKNGGYNVPYRKYTCSIFSKKDILNLSRYFNSNEISFESKDYQQFDLSFFKKGDLVYLDPPYFPCSKNQFTSYWKTPFLEKQQHELLDFCVALNKKGIKFILSNSPCEEIKRMYKNFFQLSFHVGRQMKSAKKKEDEVVEEKDISPENEILIWNFNIINANGH